MIKAEEFVTTGIRRASTFPEAMPESKRATAHPLPISQSHFASLGIDPTYGHSPQSGSDFYDPAPSLTPTSTTGSSLGGYGIAHTPQQRPTQSFPATPMAASFLDPTGLNIPVSDVNAMMFPSTDPFAYPNQPMTTFENNNPDYRIKHEASPSVATLPFQMSGVGAEPHTAAFSPSGTSAPVGPRRPTEGDVQLLGPMPMYLMHGAQQQGQRGFPPQQHPNVPMVGTPEAGGMHFDDLFGGEDWANTFMDQGLGLSGNRGGYGGTSGFGPPGPNTPHWG